MHEQYDLLGNTENDIAVVRLSAPMTLNQYVNVACRTAHRLNVNEPVIIGEYPLLE
jgi:hypothetical protein